MALALPARTLPSTQPSLECGDGPCNWPLGVPLEGEAGYDVDDCHDKKLDLEGHREIYEIEDESNGR